MSLDWLPTDETSLLDASIAYASHGFHVLPVWWLKPDGRCACGRAECNPATPGAKTSAGKHPIGTGWQKKATSDVDAVRDARKAKPLANVGLAMGGDARLVAVDIDGEAGRASWREIEASVRPAPVTLTDVSGRKDGGEHRIFSVPRGLDLKRLSNRAGFRFPGIDTRVDGGQIVAAPSVHVSGQRYRWAVRAPVAEMPEWLFEALAAPLAAVRPSRPASTPTPIQGLDPYLQKVLDNAVHDVASCTEGGRNQLLFAKSCTVFEYFIGEGLDHLGPWGELDRAGKACGLPAAEVSSVLSKAWRQASKAPPRKVPPPSLPFTQAPALVPYQAPSAVVAPPSAVAGPTSSAVDAATWEEAEDRTWESGLQRTGEGGIKNTFGNVTKILRHAKLFAGRFSFNEMRVTPYLDAKPLKDADVAKVREQLEDGWSLAASKDAVVDAIMCVAGEKTFHPVQRYLQGLAWDGEARINRVAVEILGGDDDELTTRMMRAWFVSAVARAMKPGCKVDTSLVLAGETGFRKSTFFEVLGGEWYSNSYVDVRSKDGVLQVHAAWIYEWAEVERITTRRDSADVKAFLTIACDDVRPPYGRGVVSQPRSGVIVGTTNKTFLDDETSSRRFYPVMVRRRADHSTLILWRDQLWAEAVAAYDGGEDWWLDDAQEKARLVIAQEHTLEDAWVERVANYLAFPTRAEAGVTTLDVLLGVIGLSLDRIDRTYETRAGKVLRMLGWVPRQSRRNGAIVRVYRPESCSDGCDGSSDAKGSMIPVLSLLSLPKQLDTSNQRGTTSKACPPSLGNTGGLRRDTQVNIAESFTSGRHDQKEVVTPTERRAVQPVDISSDGYPAAWDDEVGS